MTTLLALSVLAGFYIWANTRVDASPLASKSNHVYSYGWPLPFYENSGKERTPFYFSIIVLGVNVSLMLFSSILLGYLIERLHVRREAAQAPGTSKNEEKEVEIRDK